MATVYKKIFIFCLFQILFVAAIIIMTKPAFMFHVTDTVLLTPELIKKSHKLTYDQNYEINHPMRYRMNIMSADEQTSGTLLWPTKPFGRFLVVVPFQSDELNKQEVFQGRLTRCLYKCEVGGMLIEMFDFVQSIEEKFPEMKGKYSTLPSIIIDTTARPLGLDAYFNLTKYYWIAWAGFFIISVVILVWRVLKA